MDSNLETPLSNKELVHEYREKINNIKDYVRSLVTMTTALSKLPAGQSLRHGDRTINQQDVNGYERALCKELQGLVSDYQKALKPRRRKRKPGSNTYVIKVSQPIVDLFVGSLDKLGKTDISDESSKFLSSQLEIFKTKGLLLNKSILAICAIYMYCNKLQLTGKEKQFLKADTNMYKCLEDTFKELSAREQKTNASGKKITVFDPDKFIFPSWSSILSLNKVEVSEEDRAFIDSGGKELLIAENAAITNALAQHKKKISITKELLKESVDNKVVVSSEA